MKKLKRFIIKDKLTGWYLSDITGKGLEYDLIPFEHSGELPALFTANEVTLFWEYLKKGHVVIHELWDDIEKITFEVIPVTLIIDEENSYDLQ